MGTCDCAVVQERVIVPEAVTVKRTDRRSRHCYGESDGQRAGYCSKTEVDS